MLAWVDSSDRLVTGNLATFTRRVVTEVDADPAAPLVASRGYIYWVRQGGCAADGTFWAPAIEELDPATGDSTCIGPGEYTFLSADGRRVYISRTDTTLAELPSGARASRHSSRSRPTGTCPAASASRWPTASWCSRRTPGGPRIRRIWLYGTRGPGG